jgi:hypothetical protein
MMAVGTCGGWIRIEGEVEGEGEGSVVEVVEVARVLRRTSRDHWAEAELY